MLRSSKLLVRKLVALVFKVGGVVISLQEGITVTIFGDVSQEDCSDSIGVDPLEKSQGLSEVKGFIKSLNEVGPITVNDGLSVNGQLGL